MSTLLERLDDLILACTEGSQEKVQSLIEVSPNDCSQDSDNMQITSDLKICYVTRVPLVLYISIN